LKGGLYHQTQIKLCVNGEGPESLKETALRLMFRAKETICCRSEYIDVTGQLRQDLTDLQYSVTDVLDDAIQQIRDIGLNECAAEMQNNHDEDCGMSFS